MRTYTIVVELEEAGGFMVSMPALRGCITQGRSIDEWRERAGAAIAVNIAGMEADGELVPIEVGAPAADGHSLCLSRGGRTGLGQTPPAVPRGPQRRGGRQGDAPSGAPSALRPRRPEPDTREGADPVTQPPLNTWTELSPNSARDGMPLYREASYGASRYPTSAADRSATRNVPRPVPLPAAAFQTIAIAVACCGSAGCADPEGRYRAGSE